MESTHFQIDQSIAKGLTGLLIYGSNLFFNPCYAEDNAQSNKNMPPKDKKSYMSQLWGMMREGTRIKFSHKYKGKNHDIEIKRTPEGGHIDISDKKKGMHYVDEGCNGRIDPYELITFRSIDRKNIVLINGIYHMSKFLDKQEFN
ncbi:MAG: hypothetical protein U5R06_04875 [candidate division KSB1 bacterium]|nr:hypothetical protein [candidate division KSB1 bacterium]